MSVVMSSWGNDMSIDLVVANHSSDLFTGSLFRN